MRSPFPKFGLAQGEDAVGATLSSASRGRIRVDGRRRPTGRFPALPGTIVSVQRMGWA